jgi:hypothetical protein
VRNTNVPEGKDRHDGDALLKTAMESAIRALNVVGAVDNGTTMADLGGKRFEVQFGYGLYTFSGASQCTLTFPKAFSTRGLLVIANAGSGFIACGVPTTTNVVLGASAGNGDWNVFWVAIGW